MHGLQPLVTALAREPLGLLDRFLAFKRQLIVSRGH
jgi:hypothetical protein